jgi:hypothetical protein
VRARGNDAYKRRRKADRYRDFRMLADETEHEILFLGGKAYIPLFCTELSSSEALHTEQNTNCTILHIFRSLAFAEKNTRRYQLPA